MLKNISLLLTINVQNHTKEVGYTKGNQNKWLQIRFQLRYAFFITLQQSRASGFLISARAFVCLCEL